MPPACVEAHEAALSAGFLDTGLFTDDDKGFKKRYATVLLSRLNATYGPKGSKPPGSLKGPVGFIVQ